MFSPNPAKDIAKPMQQSSVRVDVGVSTVNQEDAARTVANSSNSGFNSPVL